MVQECRWRQDQAAVLGFAAAGAGLAGAGVLAVVELLVDDDDPSESFFAAAL